MPEKKKFLLRAYIAFAAMFVIAPASNAMHIMEGYLPAGYCVAWGAVCLPFLGKQEKPGPDRHVGSIYFRDLITEDPVRDGKLLPYDGDRSRSDPVRAVRRQHPGDHRAGLSGGAAGPRRADNAGGEYLFHGHRRPPCFLWNI